MRHIQLKKIMLVVCCLLLALGTVACAQKAQPEQTSEQAKETSSAPAQSEPVEPKPSLPPMGDDEEEMEELAGQVNMDWTISVTGATTINFTFKEFAELGRVAVDIADDVIDTENMGALEGNIDDLEAVINPDVNLNENVTRYMCVDLSEVLALAGTNEPSSVQVFIGNQNLDSVTLSAEEISNCYLCVGTDEYFFMDETGPVMLLMTSEPKENWVSNVARIIAK